VTLQARVVTLTLNPAVDQTAEVPGFTPGAVNRVRSARLDAGGKGINVAAFLADFGIPVAAAGFLGLENAALFASFFTSKGIADHCIRIPGASRVDVKIVDRSAARPPTSIFRAWRPGRMKSSACCRPWMS
jgi:1-phosphofructokinase